MKKTGKFEMRISPQEDFALASLAASSGTTKSGFVRMLLKKASKELSNQPAVIFKSKKRNTK